ncbi:MAG: type I DNA topoisomerase [Alistipes sp.]|jgi:DNA topoisomerase-1|nr:type I DNA topoisomerase [Alistipes sp.]
MSDSNLVIVESPSKAKTIAKYLGAGYTVESSKGHIRDLAKKGLGVDIAHGFAPDYEVDADKEKLVRDLRAAAKKADAVWLASDEDREGEAIAWHLSEALELPAEKTRRIVFHEITKPAILHAIENPRAIDMNVVNAQQARRILDRLVGFELSPLLWKKVRPSLSAGRVQSVTVRLIVEREREIMGFASTDYWRVTAEMYPTAQMGTPGAMFRAECSKRFDTRAAAEAFLDICAGGAAVEAAEGAAAGAAAGEEATGKTAAFTVGSVEEKPGTRYPAPPFTTSTLQQEAGRKLGMSVSQTMSVAQKLYEQGLITYMRTDSVNLSGMALAAAKEAVTGMFGAEYSNTRNYKTSAKGAQEAHEAIRPSYFDRQTIEGAAAEKRLYELIWKRTVASQMKPAQIDRTVVKIDVEGAREHFTATGEVIRFDGFLRLYSESVEEEGGGSNATNRHHDEAAENADATLPKMTVGEAISASAITATQRFTQPPARYSEALLVKKLEELGIGRPSTYAPTISTVITRGYVVKQSKDGAKRDYIQLTLKGGKIAEKAMTENVGKESGRLAPTDIGMLVNDYLESQFADILDYNFTAKVEKEFDEIADGNERWDEMIARFYGPFHSSIETALGTERTDTHQARVLGVDPKTGREVSARIGRFGPMVQIEPAAEGEKPRSASLKKGQLVINITLEEALELLSLPRSLGDHDGKEMVIGVGRFGPYVRHDGKFTSLGRKDDPYTITAARAIELIEEKKAAGAPLRTFAEEPDLVVKSGKFGPYIAFGGKNYKIPKGTSPEELTLDQARKIVADTPDKGTAPAKRGRKYPSKQ